MCSDYFVEHFLVATYDVILYQYQDSTLDLGESSHSLFVKSLCKYQTNCKCFNEVLSKDFNGDIVEAN